MTFNEAVIGITPENSDDYNMDSVVVIKRDSKMKDQILVENKKSPKSIVIDNNQLFSISNENENATEKPQDLQDEETINLNNTSQIMLLNPNASINLNKVVHLTEDEPNNFNNITSDGVNVKMQIGTPDHTITVTPKMSVGGPTPIGISA